MSTITKQWLQQKIAEMEAARDEIPFGLGEDDSNTLAALRIALASLEAEKIAEPVAKVETVGVCWYADNGVPRKPAVGTELYTAPPAPVAVPTFEEWCERTQQNPLGWVRDAMKEAYDGCRAAMLQGVEPVTTACKLRDAVETIRNSGIAIDAEKIFAERDALNAPDCWCRTCRPVTMTDMRFVVCPECGNKRCPHANDHRNACTGSNEPGQEGSAYPAAPQQEVK